MKSHRKIISELCNRHCRGRVPPGLLVTTPSALLQCMSRRAGPALIVTFLKLGGAENLPILAVSASAVNVFVFVVNRPLPTLYNGKKRLLHSKQCQKACYSHCIASCTRSPCFSRYGAGRSLDLSRAVLVTESARRSISHVWVRIFRSNL